MKKAKIAGFLFVILCSGCATMSETGLNYKGMSFEEFVERSQLLNSPRKRNAPYAFAIKLPRQSAQAFDSEFKTWCKENAGVTPENYQDSRNYIDPQGDFAIVNNQVGISAVQRGVCYDKSKKNMNGRYNHYLAAYNLFGTTDKYLGFYKNADIGNLLTEASRLRSIENDAFKKENECKMANTQSLRNTPKIGANTAQGMIVDLRPPLALLQYPTISGPQQLWVEIDSLVSQDTRCK